MNTRICYNHSVKLIGTQHNKQTSMTILMSIIWILLGLLQSVQSQSFTSPNAVGVFPFNEAVNVTINWSTYKKSIDVSMKCGATISDSVNLKDKLPRTTIMPPTNYTGPCTVNGKTQDDVSLTPVTIQVTGKLSITSPSTTSPLTKYPAGSSLPVSWTYTPSSASTTKVNLTCASPGAGTSTSSLVASSSDNLTIASNSYGSNCTLSLAPSDSSYILSSPVFVTVTQQLSFSSPISGVSYPLSTGTIPVLLMANSSAGLSTLVTLGLQCGASSRSISVTTNSLTNYTIPPAYYGPCTLTPVPTTPAQDYLVVPPSNLSFYLKYNITFVSFTSNPVAGAPFFFQINNDPLRNVSRTVFVGLKCGSWVIIQPWSEIPVNTLYNTTLNSDVPTGVSCILQTSAVNEYFYQATSSPFIISANTFTIMSPPAGTKLPSESSFNVTWTTSATVPGTIYSASLACNGFNTLSSNTTSLTALLSIPSTYYGDSCAVSVAATGFITAQVLVVVTQILSFETPTSGDVIGLAASSIPVKLITSGANVYADVSVSFQCAGGSATTSSFAANTDLLTQSVLPSQFGLCELTITSAPAYLVYPSPSVSFTLKYTLTFTTLPDILYRGQSFTIQIDTVTPASAPPTVTLNLFCPSPAGVVSSSWSGVLINQANNLVLISDAPLESCYFNVSSDATYTQATSSDVIVKKVPVSVSLPHGKGPFPRPHAVLLLVSTTVTPVNGTVNLQLTCTSLFTPFAFSIPINTQGSVNYPQNAYGACNLAVVDEVFS